MLDVQKMVLHGILLIVTLLFLALIISDMLGAIVGNKVDKHLEIVPILLVAWVVFALKSKRYRKN